MSSAADDELLDFFAAGLRVFGPTCIATIAVGGIERRFKFPADPSWRPPHKTHDHYARQLKSRRGK